MPDPNTNVIQITDNQGNPLYPLTDASLVSNLPGPEVFWAVYGTTTAAEMQAAMNAGKIVVCLYNGHIYTSSGVYTATQAYSWYYFASTFNDQSYYIRCRSDNDTWGNGLFTLQSTAHRVNTIDGYETATGKYPSTAATYDAIHPAIVTTQPSGGFLPNIVYDLGELTGTVTFALATPADANIANAYHWTFDTGSTAPTITWPANLVWAEGSAPTISASKHYEIMIRGHYANALEFDLYTPAS